MFRLFLREQLHHMKAEGRSRTRPAGSTDPVHIRQPKQQSKETATMPQIIQLGQFKTSAQVDAEIEGMQTSIARLTEYRDQLKVQEQAEAAPKG